jgi:Fe-S oxidoreductase
MIDAKIVTCHGTVKVTYKDDLPKVGDRIDFKYHTHEVWAVTHTRGSKFAEIFTKIVYN